MAWDLIPTLVTLAPGETSYLNCSGLDSPNSWCLIKSNGFSKINVDNYTIQVNGSDKCLNESSIDITLYPVPPVCDNILLYCMKGHNCLGFDENNTEPLYTLRKMQRNPFYIRVVENETCTNENATHTTIETLPSSEDVPYPTRTTCPALTSLTPTIGTSCPTSLICPIQTMGKGYPTPIPCPPPPECPSTTYCSIKNSTCSQLRGNPTNDSYLNLCIEECCSSAGGGLKMIMLLGAASVAIVINGPDNLLNYMY